MIWILFAGMALAAALFVALPIYRRDRRVTVGLAGAVAVVVALSAALYWRIGAPVQPDAVASIEDMVASLDRRLQENPDDVEGWRMLGRSRLQLEQYEQAVAAFERVVELESAGNAQSLAQLGEALLASGPQGAARSGEYFDSALALEPANPQALFYGGIAAVHGGDREKAADRWEALLALSPPPDIERILRPRIAEWRGESPAQAQQAAAAPEPVVAVNASLGEAAAGAVAPDATVYIIARDPARPSPPIAAARRLVSELPARVTLSDADAMIPDRLLSAQDRLEIVARISNSGEPMARPGDWYGQDTVATPGQEPVEIVIERQVTAEGGRKE
jgi:cytochrome c-type biogenesis protein CcmH